MTPEDINKKAYEKYPVKLFPDDDTLGFTSTDVNEAARMAYIEAYKEISALPTIKGWVARDMFGELNVFIKKPTKFFGKVWSDQTGKRLGLSKSLFPNLKWTDPPIEVELTIIRK